MLTCSSANYRQIPALIEVAKDSGAVDVFGWARYCPTNPEKAWESHIEPTDYRELLVNVRQRFVELAKEGCSMRLSYKDHLWELLRYEMGYLKPKDDPTDERDYVVDGCHCAQGACILANGDMYACRRMESKIGNTYINDYEQAVNSQASQAFKKYHDLEKCKDCRLLRYCRGCPAVSYGYTGNWRSPDPQCWK